MAHEAGISACWIGSVNRRGVQELYNLPEHMRVVLVLSLGYPAEESREVSMPEDGSVQGGCNSCMMCKRVILNAGISTVVVRDTPTEYRVINTADWIEDDDSLSGKFGY